MRSSIDQTRLFPLVPELDERLDGGYHPYATVSKINVAITHPEDPDLKWVRVAENITDLDPIVLKFLLGGAVLAGGSVLDILDGREPNDYDIYLSSSFIDANEFMGLKGYVAIWDELSYGPIGIVRYVRAEDTDEADQLEMHAEEYDQHVLHRLNDPDIYEKLAERLNSWNLSDTCFDLSIPFNLDWNDPMPPLGRSENILFRRHDTTITVAPFGAKISDAPDTRTAYDLIFSPSPEETVRKMFDISVAKTIIRFNSETERFEAWSLHPEDLRTRTARLSFHEKMLVTITSAHKIRTRMEKYVQIKGFTEVEGSSLVVRRSELVTAGHTADDTKWTICDTLTHFILSCFELLRFHLEVEGRSFQNEVLMDNIDEILRLQFIDCLPATATDAQKQRRYQFASAVEASRKNLRCAISIEPEDHVGSLMREKLWPYIHAVGDPVVWGLERLIRRECLEISGTYVLTTEIDGRICNLHPDDNKLCISGGSYDFWMSEELAAHIGSYGHRISRACQEIYASEGSRCRDLAFAAGATFKKANTIITQPTCSNDPVSDLKVFELRYQTEIEKLEHLLKPDQDLGELVTFGRLSAVCNTALERVRADAVVSKRYNSRLECELYFDAGMMLNIYRSGPGQTGDEHHNSRARRVADDRYYDFDHHVNHSGVGTAINRFLKSCVELFNRRTIVSGLFFLSTETSRLVPIFCTMLFMPKMGDIRSRLYVLHSYAKRKGPYPIPFQEECAQFDMAMSSEGDDSDMLELHLSAPAISVFRAKGLIYRPITSPYEMTTTHGRFNMESVSRELVEQMIETKYECLMCAECPGESAEARRRLFGRLPCCGTVIHLQCMQFAILSDMSTLVNGDIDPDRSSRCPFCRCDFDEFDPTLNDGNIRAPRQVTGLGIRKRSEASERSKHMGLSE